MNRFCCIFLLLIVCGCDNSTTTQSVPVTPGTPTFTLAWSEYVSWSTFGVAMERGLIDKRPDYLGTLEQKWGVKVILKESDYDTCITLYGSFTVDAACLTILDSLAPSLGRNSVVICPTSTSVGGDACVVVGGIKTLDDLKGKPTYGLEKSVSQYAFERNLAIKGLSVKDYPFQNMDPAAAAQALQTNQDNIESIMVWNPFVLQTLRTRDGANVLFDSATIPEEIVDSLVVGKDVLAKEGGDKFACCIIDTFYQICRMMEDPATSDETYVDLGKKFSSLGVEDMKLCCKQTQFYNTPEKALDLFGSEKFRKETTPGVVEFCVSHGICSQEPVVGFGQADAQLNFDDSYIKKVQAAK